MIRPVGVLEAIVELKENKLHGYKLLTRIMAGNEEVSYRYITDLDVRKKAEHRIVQYISQKYPNSKLFINLPESMSIDELVLLNPNAVVCIPASLSIKSIGTYSMEIKTKNLKICLDDFYTADYELSELIMGSFDYVFFREDFYVNAKRRNIERVIAYFKHFGCKVGFKKIDSVDKLEYALDLGVDLGHGYLFGQEYVLVPS